MIYPINFRNSGRLSLYIKRANPISVSPVKSLHGGLSGLTSASIDVYSPGVMTVGSNAGLRPDSTMGRLWFEDVITSLHDYFIETLHVSSVSKLSPCLNDNIVFVSQRVIEILHDLTSRDSGTTASKEIHWVIFYEWLPVI